MYRVLGKPRPYYCLCLLLYKMDENLSEQYSTLAKKLHEKTTSFDEVLRTLTHINSDLRDRCEKVLNTLATLNGSKSQKTCSVCCAREGDTVFTPCGHGLYCAGCAGRGERRGRCHACRGAVEGTLRVYV